MSRDGDGEWLSVKDAAARLSLSARSVQRQVATGKRQARHVAGKLQVLVATDEATGSRNGASESRRAAPPEWAARLAEKDALIAYLQAELTAQREARDREGSELRRLMALDKEELQRLRQQLAIAPAAEDASVSRQDAVTDEKAAGESKRAWWSRLFGRRREK
jgi:hypothetical protein